MKKLFTEKEVVEILRKIMPILILGSKNEKQAAYNKVKELSDAGYPDAQCIYADMLRKGVCGRKDPQKALSMIKELAKVQFPAAEYFMGLFYEKGIGDVKDIDKAITWYNIAALHNFKLAKYKLAKLDKARMEQCLSEEESVSITIDFKNDPDIPDSLRYNATDTKEEKWEKFLEQMNYATDVEIRQLHAQIAKLRRALRARHCRDVI